MNPNKNSVVQRHLGEISGGSAVWRKVKDKLLSLAPSAMKRGTMLSVKFLKNLRSHMPFVYAPSSVQGIPYNAASSECEPEARAGSAAIPASEPAAPPPGPSDPADPAAMLCSKRMQYGASGKEISALKQICAFLCK